MACHGLTDVVVVYVAMERCGLQVGDMVDRLYTELDALADAFGVYKVHICTVHLDWIDAKCLLGPLSPPPPTPPPRLRRGLGRLCGVN